MVDVAKAVVGLRPSYSAQVRLGEGHPSRPFTAQHNRNTPRVDRHILTIKMNKDYRCDMVRIHTNVKAEA